MTVAGTETIAPPHDIPLVTLLSLSVGLAFAEQVGINYLTPLIKPALGLTNADIGLLISGAAVTNALGSYGAAVLADRLRRKKPLLIVLMIGFSLCSVLSAFASSFSQLLAARLLMGALEGPMLPVAQSLIAASTPRRRWGTYMGIVQNLGTNFLGLFVAPLIVVAVASRYGWRAGFFVVIVPSLASVVLLLRAVREPPKPPGAVKQTQPKGNLRQVLGFRNIWLCAAIFSFLMAYATIGWAFLPLYFETVRNLGGQEMSYLMSSLAVSSALVGIFGAAISDRVGRKRTMIVIAAIGIICPLAAIYYGGPSVVLGILISVGWSITGTSPLAVATIPSETVPADTTATAMGFVLATGLLVGGFAGPALAGVVADRWGLEASILLDALCAVAVVALSCALLEPATRTGEASLRTS
jgi:ACS family hexuronate transporter-like MFS transporter